MATRKKIKVDAEVSVWHANGSSARIAQATDVHSLRVQLPGLDWLYKIDVDVDSKSGEITVEVHTNSEEENRNVPRLNVRPDGSFVVRS